MGHTNQIRPVTLFFYKKRHHKEESIREKTMFSRKNQNNGLWEERAIKTQSMAFLKVGNSSV